MSINQKKKGSRGELELVHIFNERFGGGFKRSANSGADTGKTNYGKISQLNLDEEQIIDLSGDLITPRNFKFIIESKAYSSVDFWELFNRSSNLNSFVEQVEFDANKTKRQPLLIIKYNRKPRLAFLKEKIKDKYIFEWKEYYCYYLDALLEEDDKFFFKE